MDTEFAKHSEQINAEATDWFTLIESGSASEQQRQQFEQWLTASDEHLDAYQQLKIIWGDLGELSTSTEGMSLRQSVEVGSMGGFFADLKESASHFFTESTLGLRPQLAMTIGAVAVIAGALYLSQPEPTPHDIYATSIGEIKTITLKDGSDVTLGANSTIESWSNDDERHVVLKSGQAFFVVTRDPERPFWVDAEDTRVKVVGTQFDVRHTQDRVRVAVLEGVVNVMSLVLVDDPATIPTNVQEDTPPVVLRAGQQVIKPKEDEFQPVSTISELELGAWRQGRLVYRNASLVDVIGDANRYFDGTITLEAAELSDMRVTLALATDRIALLPDMLAQSLPIVVHKTAGNRIVIAPVSEK